jgi:hypothetical protein
MTVTKFCNSKHLFHVGVKTIQLAKGRTQLYIGGTFLLALGILSY